MFVGHSEILAPTWGQILSSIKVIASQCKPSQVHAGPDQTESQVIAAFPFDQDLPGALFISQGSISHSPNAARVLCSIQRGFHLCPLRKR